MVKQSFSTEHDQNDAKVFRETLGTFGTTTKPGANQLQELQTKIKQGVKHVELHLGSSSKGEFGALDVPDKYGFEQRRTIMQLAKLNKQSLSVHGTFNITSFSGFDNRGTFDDSIRYDALKEIDETIKFAAETAKSGAVVFHIQGDGISTDRGELNISKNYLNWLENKAKTDPKYKKELENLKKNYFDANPLNREFVSNPEKIIDIKEEFKNLPIEKKKKYLNLEKESKENKSAWEYYFMDKSINTRKLSPDSSPLIVIGDKLGETKRSNELINFDYLIGNNKTKLSENEINSLKKLGIDIQNSIDIEDIQRTQALFLGDYDENSMKDKISRNDFYNLKKKLIIDYEDILKNENYLQAQADKEFHKKYLDSNIKILELQKKDFETKFKLHEDDLIKIRELEKERRDLLKKLNKLDLEDKSELAEAAKDAIKQDLNIRNYEIQNLIGQIGYQEYQELSKFDEMIANINKQKTELESQKEDIKSVNDVIFDRNASGIGHLGLKALKYQLELKKKSKIAKDRLKLIDKNIEKYTNLYNSASSEEEKDMYSNLILKEKSERNKWVGVKDYEDIDLINNPLYVAPENMLPGMGSLTSLEEYKGIMRMSQEDFAKRILSDESEYKALKEEYEKETGIKIKTHEDALKLAKRHLAGTFDNAHAGVWLKHFKKIEGETEEHRIERFNKWLNSQAEEMVKEGLVKHIHFNDTLAKSDDHNLLGSGILDLHDLRTRLRKAGIKEALIVEAGGRGANSNLHLMNALEIFNPLLSYNLNKSSSDNSSSNVSDWMTVKRNYETRHQYSDYGMSYSTFRHSPPQNGPKGNWSGTRFF